MIVSARRPLKFPCGVRNTHTRIPGSAFGAHSPPVVVRRCPAPIGRGPGRPYDPAPVCSPPPQGLHTGAPIADRRPRHRAGVPRPLRSRDLWAWMRRRPEVSSAPWGW